MGNSGYAISMILSFLLLAADGQRNDIQTEEVVSAEEVVLEELDYEVFPLSCDVSDLPPMKNEMYVPWDGKIYFRQYSDEDVESGSLWADFGFVSDREKKLMCINPDGSIEQAGTDEGFGPMFIVEGRIYSQGFSAENEYQVYSCALDGSGRIEYRTSQVLDVKNGRVICGTDSRGLSCIDTRTGQEQFFVNTYARYLGADDELIFFYGYQVNEETGTDELTLYSSDYAGNVSMLRMFTREEYMELLGDAYVYQDAMTIEDFKIADDMLYFSAGSSNGTAHMYSGGPIYSMERDGSEARVEAVSYEPYFYLYDDGENRVIYFGGHNNEDYGETVDGKSMRRITLQGEAPSNVLPWPSYAAYDEPCIQGAADAVLFYPDKSGICYVLLSPEESRALSVDTHVDGNWMQSIHDIEYAEGRLFFSVTDLTYNSQKSIGWRDYYDRGRNICYCKDLRSGEIRPLYEY
ncbi:MAG: hypothetical protein HFI52_08700 [Lachnospiraceae bacterium]|nr:hypothetical protein [Lachnospiraceae bacterium]